MCNVYNVDLLDQAKSSKLFCLYAFGHDYPIGDYITECRRIVRYCGGLPLTLIVLGRSLCGKTSLGVWRSMADNMEEIPNNKIMEKLKISYDSLEDDHDRTLFRYITCFFIGRHKDRTVNILDGCEFYTLVGIENLIDHCLLSVDNYNKLKMHQLLRDMGRDIVRQESPRDPGNRSLLWCQKHALKVLKEKSGTMKIEGFALDMQVTEDDETTSKKCGSNQTPVISALDDDSDSIGYRFTNMSENLRENQGQFETDAFKVMNKLKILHFKYVQLNGSYDKFPMSLKWLFWRGFPHESIPNVLCLQDVVALEMRFSKLKQLLTEHKLLSSQKILDLRGSHGLTHVPKFSLLPNLEILVLKYCSSLVEIGESIGFLQKLLVLNLKECKNLEKLPNNITRLDAMETLDISGCSKIKQLSDLSKLQSLKVFVADGLAITQLFSRSSD